MTKVDLSALDTDILKIYDNAIDALREDPENIALKHQAVLSLARSGALEQAQREFLSFGLNAVENNSEVASLAARLTKDRAIETHGQEQKNLFFESANQYKKAYDIGGGYYPAINTATMLFLAGSDKTDIRNYTDIAAIEILKTELHSKQDTYYRFASQAEIAVLHEDIEQAKVKLKQAIESDRLNYFAHATTLRQFTLLSNALKINPNWLDPFRPPKALHLAGRMFSSHEEFSQQHAILQADISTFIQQEDIGFAFGALAAGADILIAETILQEGGQLHVVLPSSWERFLEVSILPWGQEWKQRAQFCMDRATSVHIIGDDRTWPSYSNIELANRVAMGLTKKFARDLSTKAIQVNIRKFENNDPPRDNDITEKCWKEKGLLQKIINLPALLRSVHGRNMAKGIEQIADGLSIRAVIYCHKIKLSTRVNSIEALSQLFPEIDFTDCNLCREGHENWGVIFSDTGNAAHFAHCMREFMFDSSDGKACNSQSLLYGTNLILKDIEKLDYSQLCAQAAFSSYFQDTLLPAGGVYISESMAAILEFSNSNRFRVEFIGMDKKNISRLYGLRALPV
ncbi:MAG: TRAFs-binding domain-containing protein [bacterium]